MPRFAILEHYWPTRHWDFFLESGAVLRAWRLLAEPAAGTSVPSEPNAEHRRLYLDYEGPVNGGRGHVARWDAENEWVEMLLHSDVDQRVRGADLDLEVDFAAAEELRTEISDKFRRPGLEAELGNAGLELARWWEDPEGDFDLFLSFSAGSE